MKLVDIKDTMNNFIIEIDDAIAIVTVNRLKALNALNMETLEELSTILESIEDDQDIKGIIITGAGEKSFIAGADVSEFVPLDAVSGRKFAEYGQVKICSKIETLSKPVIAAINGFALGGGNEISMACDIRIASTKAVFGHPEAGLGIMPLYAGTIRLTRLVGYGMAKELILTSRMVKADEALRIGLINRVVEPEELMSTAKEMMKAIVAKGPLSVEMCKIAINRGQDLSLDDASEMERNLAGILFSTEDKEIGVTAYLNKMKAIFTGK